MLGLIKKIFVTLLTSIVSASNHTKCISLSNQKCTAQVTLINLHPNEYSQEFCYYPFAMNLDMCAGSCNTLDNLSSRVCILNETKHLNLHVFNITGVNESRTLTKHISCKYECKFDSKKCNSNQKWNNNKCQCECKNPKEHRVYKKNYIWNPARCSCKNGKSIGSVIDDSLVKCDEIIKETKTTLTKTIPTKTTPTKTIPTKSTWTKTTLTKCTSTNYHILITFLLITIASLMAVSIYFNEISSKIKTFKTLPLNH